MPSSAPTKNPPTDPSPPRATSRASACPRDLGPREPGVRCTLARPPRHWPTSPMPHPRSLLPPAPARHPGAWRAARAQQHQVGAREEIELPSTRSGPLKPAAAASHDRGGNEDRREHGEAAERRRDQISSGPRWKDAAEAEDDHDTQEGGDADEMIVVASGVPAGAARTGRRSPRRRAGHAGQPTCRKPSPIDPRPHRGRRTRLHEAGKHRLAGGSA